MCKLSSFSSFECPDVVESTDDARAQSALIDELSAIWMGVFHNALRLLAEHHIEARKYHTNSIRSILAIFQASVPVETPLERKLIEKMILTNVIENMERYLTDQLLELADIVSPKMILRRVGEIPASVHSILWSSAGDPEERIELVNDLTLHGVQVYREAVVRQARFTASAREEVEEYLLKYRSDLAKVVLDLSVIQSVEQTERDGCVHTSQLTSEIGKVDPSECSRTQRM